MRATRLAARIGDIAADPARREQEKRVALARRDMDWQAQLEQLMFPEKAAAIRRGRRPEDKKTCTMCGDFCAMVRGRTLFEDDIRGDKQRG